jgi:hypothetical protein
MKRRGTGGFPPTRINSPRGMWVALALALLSFLTAVAVGAGAMGVLLGASLAVVLGVLTLVGDVAAKRILVIALLVLPFAPVLPFLRSSEYNYTAYYALLAALAAARALWHRRSLPLDATLAFFAWLFVASIVGFLSSGQAASYVVAVVPLAALGTYVALRYASPAGSMSLLLGGLLVMVTAQGAIGLCQTLFGVPVFPVYANLLYEFPRNYLTLLFPGLPLSVRQATGTFNHFNSLGALLSLSTPVLVGYWLDRPGRWLRAVGAVIAVGATIATFSRGGLAGVAAGVLILATQRASAGRRTIRYAVIGASVAAVGYAMADQLSRYWSATSNVGIRERTWTIAADVAMRDPWRLALGYGLGFFREDVVGGVGAVVRLHSAPLQIALETGAVGVIVAIWMVVETWRRMARSASVLQLGVAAGVIGFFVHQVVDNALLDYPGILLAALLGILGAEAEARAGTASATGAVRDTC